MKFSIALTALLLSLGFIAACGQRAVDMGGDTGSQPMPLLIAKNGTLISGECLKDLRNPNICDLPISKAAVQEAEEVRTGRRSGGSLRGWRGSYNNWWAGSYYYYLLLNSTYQYFNSYSYPEATYSNYFGFSSNWFTSLGYSTYSPTSSYSSGGYSCGQCLRDFNSNFCQTYCVTTVSVDVSYTPSGTPANPCGGLQGSYSGVCTSNAGSSSVAISVAASGNSCVAQSSYFTPTTLSVGAGYGIGQPQQVSGGVAIQSASLTLYGSNRFRFTGYNYAGQFYFSCGQ